MGEIFLKKGNIDPEMLLSSETMVPIPQNVIVEDVKISPPTSGTEALPGSSGSRSETSTPYPKRFKLKYSRNSVLEKVRRNRLNYHERTLKIEGETGNSKKDTTSNRKKNSFN
ncbi:hypothetical protein ILUMI_16460 [Ignelater luminosus]|uniref:Uncharacterized protein n=1 Tax=Ignelater luminosus TaxID=2038154 RepID=A0A8K0CSA0_IGNLU|nr:hypothetical protein ILUMI_16460 [Ignelater luminosus]